MASSRESPLAARRSPEPFCGPGSGSSELGQVRLGTVLQPGPPQEVAAWRRLASTAGVCAVCFAAQAEAVECQLCPGRPAGQHRVTAAVWSGPGGLDPSAFTKPVLIELLPPAFVHPCGCWPHIYPCSCVQFPHGPLCHQHLSCAAPSYCVFSSHLHSHRERGRKGVLRVSRGKIGDWILSVPCAVWGEQSVEPRPDSHSLGGHSAVRVTLPL